MSVDFWFKDPKDMTEQEKWALPVGPIVQCEREYTYAEMVAGVTNGAKEYWPIMLEARNCPMTENETFWDLENENGDRYKLRQFKNGAWFREPVYL